MHVDADSGGEVELGEDHVRRLAPEIGDPARVCLHRLVAEEVEHGRDRVGAEIPEHVDVLLGPQGEAPRVHVEDLTERAAVDEPVQPEHAGPKQRRRMRHQMPVPLGSGRHERVRLDRVGGERAVDEDVLVRRECRERAPRARELGGGEDDDVEILVLQQLVEVARPGGRRPVADACRPRRLVADPAQRRLRQLVERPGERRPEAGAAAHDADGDRRSHPSLRRRTSA